MLPSKNLKKLIKSLSPVLNEGDYVFASVKSVDKFSREDLLFEFKESEGITLVLKQHIADKFGIEYNLVFSWITLQVYSSLEAIGLTDVISSALTVHKIPCNIVAGYYHDHLFVDKTQAKEAMRVLLNLSKNFESQSN